MLAKVNLQSGSLVVVNNAVLSDEKVSYEKWESPSLCLIYFVKLLQLFKDI